ncbi:uncharacterized protein BJX67DRAFT_356865 [Aspergillus lucknowensis]|uniref:Uncharacterized protein n=1 Tax=Aspergillus lucknowensis TaxID=176173 RepID=A0ABR4LN53_9EURO
MQLAERGWAGCVSADSATLDDTINTAFCLHHVWRIITIAFELSNHGNVRRHLGIVEVDWKLNGARCPMPRADADPISFTNTLSPRLLQTLRWPVVALTLSGMGRLASVALLLIGGRTFYLYLGFWNARGN